MTVWAAVLFGLSQSTPATVVFLWRYALSAIVNYVRHEPVRVAVWALSAAVVVISILTGTPVAAIVAQVVAYVALAEKVRASVTPVVKVLLEKDDLSGGGAL